MNEPARLWADPRLVYPVAILAVSLLFATVWLFRRRRESGRPAAAIFLVLSVGLHLLLLALVPAVIRQGSGSSGSSSQSRPSPPESVMLSTFDPEMRQADQSADGESAPLEPLPVSDLAELVDAEVPRPEPSGSSSEGEPVEEPLADVSQPLPPSLAARPETPRSDVPAPSDEGDEVSSEPAESLQASLDALIDDALFASASEPASEADTSSETARTAIDSAGDEHGAPAARASSADPLATGATVVPSPRRTEPPPATVTGDRQADFANRVGDAKRRAIAELGGDAETEAAVQAALRFLARTQRPDGAWDPLASGGGEERAPLGERRLGAGQRAETAITGLALLAMIGAGHTHQEGEHADAVFRGLVFLIRQQKPDGSLAGDASFYAATYSHGMAALAMAEAAAMTADPAAVEAARRAVDHTQRIQHPTTGGFRYRPGDPGDLSQLGWQAMVLDGGYRAGVTVRPEAVRGVQRFLRRVRAGKHGGLARYRPGEAPSRTMTAEALATRLLLGEHVPPAEIAEAEAYLLEQPPGVGQDNYYYWYYATLALHQLQDDAWRRWNAALKARLLASQRPDGSWPNTTLWGGYGGTVYTTAMATLCLEAYYRHAIRRPEERIANLPGVAP